MFNQRESEQVAEVMTAATPITSSDSRNEIIEVAVAAYYEARYEGGLSHEHAEIIAQSVEQRLISKK